jgi:glycosyltransferase EpsF
MNVYRNIDRSQVQFDFVAGTPSVDSYINEIRALGGRVFISSLSSTTNFLQANYFLKKVISTNHFSAVHYHASSVWGSSLRIAKKFGISDRYFHTHNDYYGSTLIKNIRNKIFSIPIKASATKFLACSKKSGSIFFHKTEFQVLHNAIDVAKFKFSLADRQQIRANLKISDDCTVLIQVARLSKEKNHIFSLEIMEQLISKRDNVMLLLVGEGTLTESVKEKVCNSPKLKDRVIFLGQVNNVDSLLSAADIFLLPSWYEGLPVSAIEAQASGLLCLLSDSITNEVNLGGVRFLPIHDGVNTWVNMIESRRHTAEYRIERNKEIRETDYSIENEVKEWMNLYNRVD